ncbi:MAG: hypothetical protein Kow0075_13800 [Salibacteraceae bacterium]
MKYAGKLLKLLTLLVIATGCLRLDSQLYNSDNTIDQYHLDNYEGEVELDVGEDYTIGDSLISLFSLQSDPGGDNKTIYVLYVGDVSRIQQDTVILYCHGNRDHLDFYWPRIKLLANAGGKNRYGVMALDYRGFGLSEGPSSEEGMYEDVDACMAWLKSMGLTDDRLVIYGYSLGSAAATELSANPRSMTPSKLMLEAPFASDEVMTQDASGLSLPGSYFSNLSIDVADDITRVSQPFFWIHGTDDDFLSIETHGELVYSRYQGSYSEAHRIEGAVHNNVPQVMGFEKYLAAVADFIQR